MIDKKNKPWFIEANYFPNGVFRVNKLEKKEIILKEFSKTISKYKHPCMIISKGISKQSKKAKKIGKRLNKYTKINLCYNDENKNNKKYLITTKKEKIIPDFIFRWNNKINKSLMKKALITNSCILEKLITNKMLTQNIIKEKTKINVPRSFFINNKKEIKYLLNKKEFENGFVIKPNNESEGKGVFILNKESKKIPRVNKKEIIQQRIIPKLNNGKYWDVRIFVINGKYCKGFIRQSKSRVTNISRGATPKKNNYKN